MKVVLGVLAVLATGALILVAPWICLAAAMGPDSPDSPATATTTYAPVAPSPTTASPSRFPAPAESPAPPVSLDR